MVAGKYAYTRASFVAVLLLTARQENLLEGGSRTSQLYLADLAGSESFKLQVTSYTLQVTIHKLQATS